MPLPGRRIKRLQLLIDELLARLLESSQARWTSDGATARGIVADNSLNASAPKDPLIVRNVPLMSGKDAVDSRVVDNRAELLG